MYVIRARMKLWLSAVAWMLIPGIAAAAAAACWVATKTPCPKEVTLAGYTKCELLDDTEEYDDVSDKKVGSGYEGKKNRVLKQCEYDCDSVPKRLKTPREPDSSKKACENKSSGSGSGSK